MTYKKIEPMETIKPTQNKNFPNPETALIFINKTPTIKIGNPIINPIFISSTEVFSLYESSANSGKKLQNKSNIVMVIFFIKFRYFDYLLFK